MRLQSADNDVTDMTSQLVFGGSRLIDADVTGRWSTDQSDEQFNVLTIANATHRDAGLFICYYVTSGRRSAYHVFHLAVASVQPPVEGMLYVRKGQKLTPVTETGFKDRVTNKI